MATVIPFSTVTAMSLDIPDLMHGNLADFFALNS